MQGKSRTGKTEEKCAASILMNNEKQFILENMSEYNSMYHSFNICKIHLKTGVCREDALLSKFFHSGCPKDHLRNETSQSVMIRQCYRHPLLDSGTYDHTGMEGKEYRLTQDYHNFYNGMIHKFRTAGKVLMFKCSRNSADFLRGNVYITYSTHKDAAHAVDLFDGFVYRGRKHKVELCPILDWKGSLCNRFDSRKRGSGYDQCASPCLFLHLFRNTFDDYPDVPSNSDIVFPQIYTKTVVEDRGAYLVKRRIVSDGGKRSTKCSVERPAESGDKSCRQTGEGRRRNSDRGDSEVVPMKKKKCSDGHIVDNTNNRYSNNNKTNNNNNDSSNKTNHHNIDSNSKNNSKPYHKNNTSNDTNCKSNNTNSRLLKRSKSTSTKQSIDAPSTNRSIDSSSMKRKDGEESKHWNEESAERRGDGLIDEHSTQPVSNAMVLLAKRLASRSNQRGDRTSQQQSESGEQSAWEEELGLQSNRESDNNTNDANGTRNSTPRQVTNKRKNKGNCNGAQEPRPGVTSKSNDVKTNTISIQIKRHDDSRSVHIKSVVAKVSPKKKKPNRKKRKPKSSPLDSHNSTASPTVGEEPGARAAQYKGKHSRFSDFRDRSESRSPYSSK